MPKAPEPFSTCQKTTKSLPRISPKSYCYNAVPNRFLAHFSTSRTNGPRLLSRAKAGTLTFANRIAHSGLHGETGAIQMGALLLPSDCFTRFRSPAWPGGRAANFAVFGSWPGVLPKNAKSLRDSDALMRVAVPRRRGPAGLRDLFSFLSKLQFSHSVLSAFRMCETRGGIITLGVLCVLLKHSAPACQSDSFVVF